MRGNENKCEKKFEKRDIYTQKRKKSCEKSRKTSKNK